MVKMVHLVTKQLLKINRNTHGLKKKYLRTNFNGNHFVKIIKSQKLTLYQSLGSLHYIFQRVGLAMLKIQPILIKNHTKEVKGYSES